jgi:hypothetical protein
MSTALRTTPLLMIGLTLIGCSKDPAAYGPGHSRSATKATSNLATVTLKIPGMH